MAATFGTPAPAATSGAQVDLKPGQTPDDQTAPIHHMSYGYGYGDGDGYGYGRGRGDGDGYGDGDGDGYGDGDGDGDGLLG